MDKITFANKNAFVSSITEELKNVDKVEDLVNDLLAVFEEDDKYGKYKEYSDLLFLLYLDKISQKLYDKSSEDIRPLVEKLKYSNSNGDGYFDKLFEAVSFFIWRLIDKPNWNVILKIDAHNDISNQSVYSLVSSKNNNGIPLYYIKDATVSRAFPLFFLYNKFCAKKIKDKELSESQVYTVHKDLSERKTIRSITYEIINNSEFVRYFDGITNKYEITGKSISKDKGEQYYLDFLECVLKEDKDNEASESKFYKFYSDHFKNDSNKDPQKSSLPIPKSFTFLNLGLSGFESWGTLMIEAFDTDGSAEEVNKVFYQEAEGTELDDNRTLGAIKSVISALKKVDDEFNEALTKEKIKKESIKSAISAIMSRNMSHNLGSHYLYYTKAHLEDMARKADSFGPDIRGAAEVLGYIQGRMDYLATLISTDKYPYAPVNFKSQLYDNLTIDSSSKRHFDTSKANERTTNFLLTNLILSENFTRPDIFEDTEESPFDLLQLQVKYKDKNSRSYQTFTGTNNDNELINPSVKSEAQVKNALAELNIAMPGGTMSCHAFYNIIENFIRNSAKYRRDDFETQERYIYDENTDTFQSGGKFHNLTITIAICPNKNNSKYIDFVIYDNKANATYFKPNKDDSEETRCLLQILNDKLRKLKILNEDNTIDKDNKGLKEMLFSAAWMRAYTFGQEKNYADIISDIQSMSDENKSNGNKPDGEEKLEEINDHCFSFVAVDDTNDDIKTFFESDLSDNYKKTITNNDPLCIGIKFTMPLFLDTDELDNVDDEQKIIEESLLLFADVAISERESNFLSQIYPRCFFGAPGDLSGVEILRRVIKKRFPDIDNYRLVFGTNADKASAPDKYIIKFRHHMSSQEKNSLSDNLKYAYADTVSGGNFTKTMNELFDLGNPLEVNTGSPNYKYKSVRDEMYALKIKESALTRITLIDERLSNNAAKRGESYAIELQLKNLSILNYKENNDRENSSINSILDLFSGIKFKDSEPKTHFLSIHLGIIEKILKNSAFNDYVTRKDSSISSVDGKAKFLMEEIRKTFGGNDTYITIHSGRGNFSKELEGPLDTYPFITLSAIESAYNNCKFLLSQLFYSTRYVGKGRYNKR